MNRPAYLVAPGILLLGTILLLPGCDNAAPSDTLVTAEGIEALAGTGGLSATTIAELQRVRQRTRVLKDLNYAQAHGYTQASEHVPQMGVHFVRFAWIDGTFDYQKPEALLFADVGTGAMELVGVEYVVPFEASEAPPSGFTGEDDVWHADEDLGAWTLHAWVWTSNPDGVFTPFNPLIP